jgi:hypothetical protein
MSDQTSHWRLAYLDRYLGAWSLFDRITGRYREVAARIDRVSDDEVTGEGGRKSKPWQLHLSGRKGPIRTPMIVSKTSGKTLEMMFGATPASWVGHEIVLYVRKSRNVRLGTGDILTIRNTCASDRLRKELQEDRGPAIEEGDLSDPIGGDDASTH